MGFDFNSTAFGLDESDPDAYFSDAIVGEDTAYVIATHERQESRIPDFEEVASIVSPVAEYQAEREVFQEKIEEIRDSVESQLKSGKTFTEIVTEFDLTVVTTRPFIVYDTIMSSMYDDESNRLDHADALIPAARWRQENELADLMPVEEGALLAYVADRSPGDPATTPLLASRLRGYMDTEAVTAVFQDWANYLLLEADFTDFFPIADNREEEEEEEKEEEEEREEEEEDTATPSDL